jgi:hypothetical protein
MYWWYVFGLTLAACIVFAIVECKTYSEWPVYVSVLSGCLAFALLLVCIFVPVDHNQEIMQFQITKSAVEQYKATSEYQDFGLTAKVFDMNQWLFSAQAKKKLYGEWSFYPADVLDMAPIQK